MGKRIINPYANVDFAGTPRVPANSHEHIYSSGMMQSSYRRGIRTFACVNYFPSASSVCPAGKLGRETACKISDCDIPVTDWIDPSGIPQDVQNNAFNMSLAQLEQYKTVRRHIISAPTIEDDGGNTIYTNTIPQIANMEFAFVPWVRGNLSDRISQHFNVLGNLFPIPTNGMTSHAIFEDMTWDEEKAWRSGHPLYSMEELMSYVTSSQYQQFEGKIFGTANHNYDVTGLKKYFDRYPQVFKAMECFNQCYSRNYNNAFRDAYDTLLRDGYRIWGTAVADWQGTREVDLLPAEQAEWIAAYNALTPEQQAYYGSWKNYYNATAEKECGDKNRGCNVLYIPNYETMLARDPQEVAEAALDAYIAGRYYMSGWGGFYIQDIDITPTNITLTVSGSAETIRGITNTATYEGTGSSITVPLTKKTSYVRFEAYFADKDFIFTNPIFIENDKAKGEVYNQSLILGIV